MRRIKTKYPKILVQDSSCRWYLIPANQELEFNEWVNKLDKEEEYHSDFTEYGIDGPHSLVITEYSIIQ